MKDEDRGEPDCVEAMHRVYHFLDGELTPENRKAIAKHLDKCSPCVEIFGFESEIRRLVADRCREQVPAELRQRIAAAIDHEHRSSSAPPNAARGSAEL